ncbi:I78 family peptidase inhibitor [Roseicyclus sp. F158]|uniref:I78 family peptidase inhibitor n=1 Tax=Tropicimonas omnivorans TaxID=3075590 RepID=A0ABU3DCJ1_9RHOB|nr:I78 family peptidase inhibitor [Roseicyclus sp. F158]MDT0681429.1 I78 family peptidase inhibitor [Roseicyclus sp. F158]
MRRCALPIVIASTAILGACTSSIIDEGSDMPPSGSTFDPATPPATGSGIDQSRSGLETREPDTCQIDEFRGFTGQPATVAESAVSGRPVRVIPPDAIVTQEYLPRRVNFFTDGAGTVVRVTCG